MFDRDLWAEIFQSISKNKLRSILSGFTITFAILIFTLLFGISNGLQNTFSSFFINNTPNAIYIYSGKATVPFKGKKSGRRVQLTNKEVQYIKETNSDKVQYLSPKIYKNFNVSYEHNKNNYPVNGVLPDNQFIDTYKLSNGRFINLSDIQKNNKTAVIGRLVKNDLFKNKNAIGKYINLQGINFKVIGVFEKEGDDNAERVIYIPLSTSQSLYANNDYVDQIDLTYNKNMSYTEVVAFSKLLEKQLKELLIISPNDQGGIWIRNVAENIKDTNMMMLVLTVLIFFIGFGTLIAGIVGISNIMIYVVSERTKELGVRKVLGASPKSIVALILLESITITSIAGYLGILIGIGTVNLIGDSLEKYFITNPSVDTSIIIGAMITLVISGCIAGYVPAKRASKIKPIVALRDE
ncbi:ABC transporter ATP-binding protein [Wenyingzhuangia fucanilytica]|uniref:ABC transporter ATP-binding protein n=1 Tax=Wenyingzhuangia fucanilytica TaxID=1790137 RepID=A0A1B1Y427_9FLAO|nr:ABC transporter permease [Wenyingzhuangia fucanilytica]ANW95516.1 ABC transporter ATP-binding protein [Wenyingzhuangia fucanilytica]